MQWNDVSLFSMFQWVGCVRDDILLWQEQISKLCYKRLRIDRIYTADADDIFQDLDHKKEERNAFLEVSFVMWMFDQQVSEYHLSFSDEKHEF